MISGRRRLTRRAERARHRRRTSRRRSPSSRATAGASPARRWRPDGARRRAASSCRPASATDIGLFLVVAGRRRRHARAPGDDEPRAAVRDASSTACEVVGRGTASARSPTGARTCAGSSDRTHRPASARSPPARARRRCGSPPSTRPSASSSTARSARSRPSASGWPTPTSTPRRSTSRCSRPRRTWPQGQASPTEVATAKFWAAEGGSRVVHAALHVHGGISIDLDYPIHRYFLWVKQVEFTLGAATPSLRDLGRLIAANA